LLIRQLRIIYNDLIEKPDIHTLGSQTWPRRMSTPSLPEIDRLEESIQVVKSEISKISDERWRAASRGDDKSVLKAKTRAVEKMLENCDVIARYVSQFCPAIGRDLSSHQKVVRSELEKIKRRSNQESLHTWYKADLIPLVKRSEVVAHVAATSHRRGERSSDDCHRWPLSARTSS
jgi:hypothetical protein